MTEENQKEMPVEESELAKTQKLLVVGMLAMALTFGYQDKEDALIVHKDVVFSKRPTGADFIRAIEETNGEDPEFELAIIAASITAFGDLPMPVPQTVLLSLNWRDRELLTGKFYEFLGATAGDGEAKQLSVGKVQLAFGIERGGVRYMVVEFGTMLNAYDEIAIRKEAASIAERRALKIGRSILKISTADGSREISGGLTLDELKNLDWDDFVTVRKAEEDWQDSFRA